LKLPPITKPPKRISFGLQIGRMWNKWYINPTRDGICFGPKIKGYNIHLTAYEKNGFFYSHITYAEKGDKEERIEVTAMKKEELINIMREEYERCMSRLLKKYDIYGEAVVSTNMFRNLLREILKRIAIVDIKGRELLMNLNLDYLAENEKLLERKTEELGQLFVIGTVVDALKNNSFRDRWILSPDCRPIVIIDGEAYIFRRNPVEILRSISSTELSVEEFFRALKRSELSVIAKIAELLGLEKLFIEMWRRNIFEKIFSPLSI